MYRIQDTVEYNTDRTATRMLALEKIASIPCPQAKRTESSVLKVEERHSFTTAHVNFGPRVNALQLIKQQHHLQCSRVQQNPIERR